MTERYLNTSRFLSLYFDLSNHLETPEGHFFEAGCWGGIRLETFYFHEISNKARRITKADDTASDREGEEELLMAREYSRKSNILTINKCAQKNNIDHRALELDSIKALASKIHCLVGLIRGKDVYITEGDFRGIIADEFQGKYSVLFDEGVEIENDPLSKKSLDRAIELFEIVKGVYYEINSLDQIIKIVTKNKNHIVDLFFGKCVRLVNGTFDYSLVKKVTSKNLGFRFSKYTRVGVYCELIEKVIDLNRGVHGATQSTHLKGTEFELEVARSYMWLGYKISMTKASGDFGIDIIAASNSEKIGIQCKNLSSPVGVNAIMQVSAGARFYDCTKCCVITTQGYTESAIEMANKLGVELLISRWR